VDTTREQHIVQALVDIVDNLVDHFDVVELLTNLADRCVNVLGVSAAGVMLESPPDELRLVASSSEAMQVVEMFELQANEGPCLDAFRTGERVGHEKLQSGSGPWPQFSKVALASGFRSVSALPLRLRDATIGALNLFSVEELPMDERDVLVARAFADLATISILQHGTVNEGQQLNEQLAGALASRIVIEQAKGVIAERTGIEVAEAFSRLRNYARSRSMLLTDIAQAAIGLFGSKRGVESSDRSLR
jgi:transcriptional regulator with GAF, ATPase, and Fis domain